MIRVEPGSNPHRDGASAATLLVRIFSSLSEENLDRPSPEAFPMDDDTVRGAVAFLPTRASYHAGQLCVIIFFHQSHEFTRTSPGHAGSPPA